MEKIGGIRNIMHYLLPKYDSYSDLTCGSCIYFHVIDLETVCHCSTFVVMHTEPDKKVCDFYYEKGKG